MCISGKATTCVSGEAVAVFFFCTQNLALCTMIVPVKSLCVNLLLQVHSVTE